ncbi:nucleoside deaminase [Granulicella sp. 5B5]|uniref:nucleoside deaminase n=1 Tax=Granulicella sp. 5B5 TaxID=1617967 RepID=UPI001C71466F|nr:nucleoside deaminase [Granulicella sp. 5B5]
MAQGNPEFMMQAIQLAIENVMSGRGGPFGAVIVKDGKVIATGANQVTASHDPTAHAEVMAIRAACKALETFSLEGCELYTSCEPCPMCLAASYWARCSKIYYGCVAADAAKAGFDDAFLYDEMKKPLGERALPIVNLMPAEAWAAFAAWIESDKKVEY